MNSTGKPVDRNPAICEDGPVMTDVIITVVMPTFNRLATLRRALESVLEQSRGDARIRIHVWDNHSTDGTEEYLASVLKNEPGVTYTRRPVNLGALGNYHDAIANVETPYYACLADDDFFYPDFLSAALHHLVADPSLGALVMQTVHVTPEGTLLRVNPDERWHYGKMQPEEMMDQWSRLGHFEWSSIVFKKSVYDAVGGLNVSIGLAADVDFQMQVFLRFPVMLVPQRAAAFTLHPKQQSAALGLAYPTAALQIIKNLAGFAKNAEIFAPLVGNLRKRYADEFFGLGWKYNTGRPLLILCGQLCFSFRSPRRACSCVLRAALSHLGFTSKAPRPFASQGNET
jgi:glycosyltransferase involved in cell wall biosynthesis